MRAYDRRPKHRFPRALALTLLLGAAGTAGLLRLHAQAKLQSLMQESQFIFSGTVKKLRAATLPDVEPTDRTVIVTVDEVFLASPALGDHKGKDVTVQLQKPGEVTQGQRLVFFTTGWIYGVGLAVREVGHLEPGAEPTALRQQLAQAIGQREDQSLQSRIARASLVVVGKVLSAEPFGAPGQPRSISEHDPMWWRAVVEIESVAKGEFSGRSIVVLFPKSTDVVWQKTPKFNRGQEGIWVLQRQKIEALRTEGFTALNPLDYLGKDQLDRVIRLIKASGGSHP